uniref:Putative EF-hand domain pair, Reverse transcriptase, RNA-dependent DNA polymerase n=1 Tax=Helianthus annuus TaxID=4232 RepID=A0A251S4G8_HELAN
MSAENVNTSNTNVVVGTTANTVGASIVANHAERPEKFSGLHFKRWQQKMFFYLTTMNLARFLTETAPQPAEGETDAQALSAVEAWKHSDFICRGYTGHRANQCKKPKRERAHMVDEDDMPLIAMITSIRLVLAIAALRNLEVHQIDVKTAFLNGDLKEEIYMEQSDGFSAPGNECKVCKLVKSLYGLKQAPKQWHQKFVHVMIDNGFKINECDKYDMLIIGSDDNMINSTKDMLKARLDMKDMGLADVILGVKITRTQNGLVLNQSHYVDKILGKFNSNDTSIARTPIDNTQRLRKNRGESVAQLEYSRIIGSLMYLMTCSRPDLAYAVSRLSRYIRYTRDYGLHYTRDVIEGYTEANWISEICILYSAPVSAFALHKEIDDLFFRLDDNDDLSKPDEEEQDGDGDKHKEADMMEAFKVFDEDEDGYISAKELQTVLVKLGFAEGNEFGRVEMMISSVDRNHDGLVDFTEFKDMMRIVIVLR